jgi:hypothetical protein
MASVTNWIEHLTTDVDAATDGVQVADIYPMVGSEWMWLTVAIIFWLAWHFATASGEAEEHQKLARKRPGANDYKKNIAEW